MKSPLFGCLNLHFRWLNLHFRWLNLRFSWLNLRFSLAKWHFFLANHRRKPKRRSSPRPRRPLPARQRLWRWGFTGHGAPYAPLSAEIYICIYIYVCMYVYVYTKYKIHNTIGIRENLQEVGDPSSMTTVSYSFNLREIWRHNFLTEGRWSKVHEFTCHQHLI